MPLRLPGGDAVKLDLSSRRNYLAKPILPAIAKHKPAETQGFTGL